MCVRAVKALTSMRICADSSEPSLLGRCDKLFCPNDDNVTHRIHRALVCNIWDVFYKVCLNADPRLSLT